MALMPVEDALRRILHGVKPLAAESVPLAESLGRVLAKPLAAKRDQPPFAASAMDGYAVIAADVATTPARLQVVGVAAAGHGFKGRLRPGQCVRIFTGAPLPRGADTVVIQENATALEGSRVEILQAARQGQNVRVKGLDFRRGEALLPKGLRLNARDIALAAAANAGTVAVARRPRVALFATGDELVAPGGRPGPDQIISSNSHALAAMAALSGAEVINLGIVPDTLKATARAIARAAGADILLTTGGASVGDHDYVQEALRTSGVAIDFWKIAMRPGKPFMYGRRKGQHVLGLPGNPVSALVCARLFLKPLLGALQGLPAADELVEARLGAAMKENDGRQDYVRATLAERPDGSRTVTPFPRQDSSMQRTFREAQALIVRPPHAPAASPGDVVKILRLDF
jgi:molybdopterin molybdotransferase